MSQDSKAKNIFSFFLRLGLSVLLLAYLFRKVDFEKTAVTLQGADFSFVGYAFGVFVILNFLLLARWTILIRALQLRIPGRVITRYFFVGLFGNLFLPSAIGGDLIKIIGLCRYNSERPKIVATVLLDRLSGFVGIVLTAIIAFLFGWKLVNHPTIITAIIAMAVGSCLVGIVLFNQKVYSACCWIFSAFPRLKKALMQMHYDIMMLKDNPLALVQVVGISMICQVGLAISFYCVARALHQEIALGHLLIFVPMICVASSLPSIGGLGVREAGAAYLFAKVGVETGVSVSISLVNFLFMVLVGLAGGVIYFVTKNSYHDQKQLSSTTETG
ncbi:MAG: flippase-like domain-containing protein [Candidatus Omnitrophica bacterium]|nr:flippase-like domain-containing protein [Candidatus Omnitrophota bacterium]